MRRNGVKREKSKKINKMNTKELVAFLKDLEGKNQTESHVYKEARKQLSLG